VFEGGDGRVVGVFVEDGEAVAAVSGGAKWSVMLCGDRRLRRAIEEYAISLERAVVRQRLWFMMDRYLMV